MPKQLDVTEAVTAFIEFLEDNPQEWERVERVAKVLDTLSRGKDDIYSQSAGLLRSFRWQDLDD